MCHLPSLSPLFSQLFLEGNPWRQTFSAGSYDLTFHPMTVPFVCYQHSASLVISYSVNTTKLPVIQGMSPTNSIKDDEITLPYLRMYKGQSLRYGPASNAMDIMHRSR